MAVLGLPPLVGDKDPIWPYIKPCRPLAILTSNMVREFGGLDFMAPVSLDLGRRFHLPFCFG